MYAKYNCSSWCFVFARKKKMGLRGYPNNKAPDQSANSHNRTRAFTTPCYYSKNNSSSSSLYPHFTKFERLKEKFNITKTRLYNFDPLKPHFYIVKLGFTGVYIIFLISAQKHRLWVLVRTASRVPTIYILSRNMKNISVFYFKFSVFGGEIFYIFE